MIIPQPKLERIPYAMHGMNCLEQIFFKWRNPPRYRLLEDYIITLDDGLQLLHPAGFVIDGASVPRPLWPMIEPTGTLLEGSVPHDMYYQYGYLLAVREPGRFFNIASEKLAEKYPLSFGDKMVPVFIGRGQLMGDKLLRGITIEKHGATFDAERAYYALRMFGWIAWNKYRQHGPTAYTVNSLDLPGVTEKGPVF